MPQVTNNNTVTKTDVQLDCVLLQRRKGFPWVTRSYRIGNTRNIFVTGFAVINFIIYPLELRVWVLIWLLYCFNVLIFSSSKFYRSQQHDKNNGTWKHHYLTNWNFCHGCLFISRIHNFEVVLHIITSRQLRKKV